MSNGSGFYVLCSDPCDHELNGYSCYVSQGPFQGVEDVVGSSGLKDARLFNSWDEADDFARNELPAWAKKKFQPVEVKWIQLLIHCPERYGELRRLRGETDG